MKILERNNQSILGGRGFNRIHRNNISHTNMYYDEETNTIYLGRDKIKLEELEKALAKLLLFQTIWLRKTLNTKNLEETRNKIEKTLRETYRALAKEYHKKRYHKENPPSPNNTKIEKRSRKTIIVYGLEPHGLMMKC